MAIRVKENKRITPIGIEMEYDIDMDDADDLASCPTTTDAKGFNYVGCIGGTAFDCTNKKLYFLTSDGYK